MRISPDQIRIVRQTLAEDLGASAEAVLFGSRLDDATRGGDIDLMVTLPTPVDRPALRAARLAARLERRLGGRRVDVILVTPNTLPQPIHEIARRYGVAL